MPKKRELKVIDKSDNISVSPAAQSNDFAEKAIVVIEKTATGLNAVSATIKIIISSVVFALTVMLALAARFIGGLIVRLFPSSAPDMSGVGKWTYIVLGVIAFFCVIGIVVQCVSISKGKRIERDE